MAPAAPATFPERLRRSATLLLLAPAAPLLPASSIRCFRCAAHRKTHDFGHTEFGVKHTEKKRYGTETHNSCIQNKKVPDSSG